MKALFGGIEIPVSSARYVYDREVNRVELQILPENTSEVFSKIKPLMATNISQIVIKHNDTVIHDWAQNFKVDTFNEMSSVNDRGEVETTTIMNFLTIE